MSGEINNPIYPIQLVSRRSGLSVELIRAWERRYRVVSPRRAQNQRRLYSEQDVQHLTLLHRLTAQGHRIGDIVALDKEQLESLLEPINIGHQPDQQSALLMLRKQALLMVESLDREGLNRLLAEAELQLPLPLLLNEWIAPLMALIGGAWKRGELRIYQEHMASAVISGWMMSKIRQQQNHRGPVLLVTTPVAQQHALGAARVWQPVKTLQRCSLSRPRRGNSICSLKVSQRKTQECSIWLQRWTKRDSGIARISTSVQRLALS